jgi:hypothetical protein
MKTWLIALLVGLSIVVVLSIVLSIPKKRKVVVNPANLPKVCQVWNRWKRLTVNTEYKNFKRFGKAWDGNVCPAGNYFQAFDGTSAFCTSSLDQNKAVVDLCKVAISNDDIAIEAPATVEPGTDLSGYDHWVFLTEGIAATSGERKGTAWQGNVCPSGAGLQRYDNATWCVFPSEISLTFGK